MYSGSYTDISSYKTWKKCHKLIQIKEFMHGLKVQGLQVEYDIKYNN